MSRPPMAMVPASNSRKRSSSSTRVDLPAPLGPDEAEAAARRDGQVQRVEDQRLVRRRSGSRGRATTMSWAHRRAAAASAGSATGGGASMSSNRRAPAAVVASYSCIDCVSGWTASKLAIAASGTSGQVDAVELAAASPAGWRCPAG